MKKLIISITIISFMNLIGCYYQEQMNPGTYNFDEEDELHLTTKDTTYNIGKKDYHLENDTLFVTFKKKLDRETTLKTVTEIPVNEIESVEVEKTDAGMTVLLTLGIVVGALGLIFLLGFDMGPLNIKGPGESGGNSL